MAQDDERRSSSKQEAPRFVWEAAEPAGQGDGTGSSKAPTPSEPRDAFPPRRALVAGAAAVVLAAGAFGIVDYTDRGPTTAAAGNTTPSAAGASSLTSSFPSPTPAASGFASRSPSPSASPSALPRTTAGPSPQSPAPSASTAARVTITTAAAATTSAATDLALGTSESSSSHTGNSVASNVIDGKPTTYWESQVDSGDFSEWVQVDLGTARTVAKVVMRLPPSWSSRTQTIEIYGLATGYNGFVIKSPTSYTFSQSADNTVTVTFAALSTRYVQLIITANSAVSAGQMGEVEIYG